MSVFELLEQPFNVVHEMYRLVYLKGVAQKKKEEEEQKRKAEQEEADRRAHEEEVRGNVPVFATKTEVLGKKDQAPPQEEETKANKMSPAAEAAYRAEIERRAREDKEPPKLQPIQQPNTVSEAERNPAVQQMIAGQMQDVLEEVMS